jgi:hypothetical protein
MAGQGDDNPEFSVSDLEEHVEVYGVDLYPTLDLSMETVRAQALFTELRDRWPHLYQSVTMGGADFAITAAFKFGPGKEISVITFNINPRGPVFTFPRRLSVFREEVDLQGSEPAEVFEEAFNLFLKTFPTVKPLRLGLVRRLTFGTGQTDCASWLGKAVLEFDSARLGAAQCLLVYHDEEYNYRVQMETARLVAHNPVPATGGVVAEPDQFALSVNLDVNNREARSLSLEERRQVVARANELWPDGVLEFLNHRRLP